VRVIAELFHFIGGISQMLVFIAVLPFVFRRGFRAPNAEIHLVPFD
jgi:hypothetical protein